MVSIRKIMTQHELEQKRMHILKEYADRLGHWQKEQLIFGQVRAPAYLAFNPGARILIFGREITDCFGSTSAEISEEEFNLHFLRNDADE